MPHVKQKTGMDVSWLNRLLWSGSKSYADLAQTNRTRPSWGNMSRGIQLGQVKAGSSMSNILRCPIWNLCLQVNKAAIARKLYAFINIVKKTRFLGIRSSMGMIEWEQTPSNQHRQHGQKVHPQNAYSNTMFFSRKAAWNDRMHKDRMRPSSWRWCAQKAKRSEEDTWLLQPPTDNPSGRKSQVLLPQWTASRFPEESFPSTRTERQPQKKTREHE